MGKKRAVGLSNLYTNS